MTDRLISLQAAIDAIHEDILLKPLNDSWYRENHEFVTVGYVERTLLALPSAQPERKKGQWIRNDNGTYSCSVCQSWIPEEQHCYARYCLYCGADMRGE